MKGIFDELDGVVSSLRKMYGDEDEEMDMGRRRPEEEDEEMEEDEEEMPPRRGREEEEEDLRLSFPTTAKARNSLVKALNSLSYSNQGKKTIVSGTEAGGDLQDNFKQEGLNDESIEGMQNYDKYDEGYGGPAPMNPKLMTPKEYEELWNKVQADGNKGPSINTTVVSNQQAYESKKSWGQDDGLVDVTDFMKSFDGKVDSLGATVAGLTQTIGKIAQAQVASSKAIASMMSASRGRNSVSSLNKGMGQAASQRQLPTLSKAQVLPALEKGVADGKLEMTELTKFELSGQMTQPVAAYLQMEGGLK